MVERLGEGNGIGELASGATSACALHFRGIPCRERPNTHVNDREGNPFNWLVCVVHGQPLDAEAKPKHAQFRCDLRGEHVVTRARRLVCTATSGRSAGAAPLTMGSLCRSVGFDE